MRKIQLYLTVTISICLTQFGAGDPLDAAKVLDSQSCMTSGCHGGAGLNRGAYNIWKNYDPHFNAAATLTNGRSRAMARQLGIENPAESKSCTICHSPMSQVPVPSHESAPEGHRIESGVACANCHGPAEKWLLSHTRPDYPKDALARLGMRQLGTAYQRANSCVACHQNLSDELMLAKHPALVFELDGLLVAEPKHWREEKEFSNAQTWLVGQAVALREAAAQAIREPVDLHVRSIRTAEIEAIKALLEVTDTGWDDSGKDLVRSADEYAKRISGTPLNSEKSRAILDRLIASRTSFQPDSFSQVDPKLRWWSVGYYTERLTLAVDRLNQPLVTNRREGMIAKDFLNELFDAAKPPESFDSATVDDFLEKLDRVAKSQRSASHGR